MGRWPAYLRDRNKVFQLVSKRLCKSLTAAQGLLNSNWVQPLRGKLHGDAIIQVLRLKLALAHTQLPKEPDRLIWRWTANSINSASSCYQASFHGSVQSDTWQLTWKTWASRRAKFFWLASLDRCWTVDRLERRGLPHKPRCVLRDQCPETIRHLLVDCPFAQHLWFEVLSWVRATCLPPQHETKIGD